MLKMESPGVEEGLQAVRRQSEGREREREGRDKK